MGCPSTCCVIMQAWPNQNKAVLFVLAFAEWVYLRVAERCRFRGFSQEDLFSVSHGLVDQACPDGALGGVNAITWTETRNSSRQSTVSLCQTHCHMSHTVLHQLNHLYQNRVLKHHARTTSQHDSKLTWDTTEHRSKTGKTHLYNGNYLLWDYSVNLAAHFWACTMLKPYILYQLFD